MRINFDAKQDGTACALARTIVKLFGVMIVLGGIASTGNAALVLHMDPNVVSSQFNASGQVVLTGAGDTTQWITDVRSPTPGGLAYDNHIDAEGNSQSPTLVSHPTQGTVWSFDGAVQRMLMRRVDTIISSLGRQDGFGAVYDTNTLTAIVVGRVEPGGADTDNLFDTAEGSTTAHGGFGLRYDYSTGKLEGYADQTQNTEVSLAADKWFVATYVWNGSASTAALTVETADGVTSDTNFAATSLALVNVTEMRIGTRTLGSSGGTRFFGNMGDLMLFSDVDDHSDVARALARQYGIRIPEPASCSLLFASAIGLLAIRRRN